MVSPAVVALATETATGPQDTFRLEPVPILNAVVVLVVAYLVAKGLGTALNALASRFLANRFHVTLVIPAVKFLVYGTATYVAITILFELTSEQLLAFSGLFGAALGFGLQDLFGDLIGGLVLVVEQPYRIGDKVSIGDYYGEIVGIGIRSTKLLTLDDTLVSVPNYLFFNESIANANAGQAEMLVVVEFYIDPESDAREARRIVEDALVSSQYVYVDDDCPVEVFLTDDLHYRTVTGKAYVNDLRNELRFETDVTDRVLKEFGRREIRSPKVPAGIEPGGE